MSKIILVCKQCGSKDIQQLVWAKVNVQHRKIVGDGPDEINSRWCDGCKEHVNFISQDDYEPIEEEDDLIDLNDLKKKS